MSRMPEFAKGIESNLLSKGFFFLKTKYKINHKKINADTRNFTQNVVNTKGKGCSRGSGIPINDHIERPNADFN